jgi:hypothetical protein
MQISNLITNNTFIEQQAFTKPDNAVNKPVNNKDGYRGLTEPSGNLLKIYFTGLPVITGVKEGIKVPESVVKFCKDQEYHLIGKSVIKNKLLNKLEDAFIVAQGPINTDTIPPLKNNFASFKKSLLDNSIRKNAFPGFFTTNGAEMRILVLDSKGKIAGFNENNIKLENRNYIFNAKDTDAMGYLYAERQGNLTSEYFEDVKDDKCFSDIYHQFSNFKDYITTDEYGGIGTLNHFTRVSLSDRLGLKGRVQLNALQEALPFHSDFGFVVTHSDFYPEMCLPEKRSYLSAYYKTDNSPGHVVITYLPIKAKGKYVIEEILEKLEKDPILLKEPVHYDDLNSNEIYK